MRYASVSFRGKGVGAGERLSGDYLRGKGEALAVQVMFYPPFHYGLRPFSHALAFRPRSWPCCHHPLE
jgi:hypothetical protein